MEIEVRQTGQKTEIAVIGELTIRHAAELKEKLSGLMGRTERVEVNLAGITHMDLAGLQLLCSAYKASCKRRFDLSITGSSSKVVKSVTRDLGFASKTGCCPEDGDGIGKEGDASWPRSL